MMSIEFSNKCRTYLHLKVRNTSDVSLILENEIGIKDYEIFSDNIIKIIVRDGILSSYEAFQSKGFEPKIRYIYLIDFICQTR